MSGRMAPRIGSGERTSTTIDAVEVYFLGRTRLTASVAPTMSRNTASALHMRARRMSRTWVRVICRDGSANRAGSGLEQAFLHEDHVVREHRLVRYHVPCFRHAGGIAAGQLHPAHRAAQREAAAGGERLDDGHVALDAVLARALHLAVDIEERRAGNVDDIAVLHRHVLREVP